MTRVAASDLRKDCAKTLNQVLYQHKRIIVERHGKDTAALVPLEDLALLEALEDQMDLEEARAALAEAQEKGTKPLASVMRELGLSR
jgi:prevent-host-death family protein